MDRGQQEGLALVHTDSAGTYTTAILLSTTTPARKPSHLATQPWPGGDSAVVTRLRERCLPCVNGQKNQITKRQKEE